MKLIYMLGIMLLASIVACTMAFPSTGQMQQLQTSPFANPHTYLTTIYNSQIMYGTLPPAINLIPGDELYVAVNAQTPVNVYTTDASGYANYMAGSSFNYYPEFSARGVTSWAYTAQANSNAELYVVVQPQYQGELPMLTVIRGSEYTDDQHLSAYRQTVQQQGQQIDSFIDWYQSTFDPDSFSYG